MHGSGTNSVSCKFQWGGGGEVIDLKGGFPILPETLPYYIKDNSQRPSLICLLPHQRGHPLYYYQDTNMMVRLY